MMQKQKVISQMKGQEKISEEQLNEGETGTFQKKNSE